MPTSTPWRDRQSDTVEREQSPSRPTDDHIERLSPAPFPSSHTSYHHSAKRHVREQQLRGLGLVGSSTLNNALSIGQPDHIYIDQDGGAHLGSKVRSTLNHSQLLDSRYRDGRNDEARYNKSSSKQNRSKSHTRSGSTIDDLANIAIATSPTFDHGSPTFAFSGSSSIAGTSRPATSYIEGYTNSDRFYDRPAKRVRSEKLPSLEWSTTNERPRTSHGLQPQTSMEDAELLLGLRHGYSFSTNTSPVFAAASAIPPPDSADLVRPPLSEDAPAIPEPICVDEKQDVTPEQNPIKEDVIENKRQQEKQVDPENMEIQDAMEHIETPEKIVSPDKETQPASVSITTKASENTQTALPEVSEIPVAVQATASTKKPPRKIKPEIQAEVCAACQKLQRDINSEDAPTQWICCDYCRRWFHLVCGGFKDKADTRAVDKFVCKDCEPRHGQTTFVRKSTRVRTAIDYAGLNQGVVKSAEESTMHHYIQPIKDCTIKYQADNFARVRPELLTAEFWENMDNMKRPFVVPACWNPRFGKPSEPDAFKQDSLEAEPVSEPSFTFYNSSGNTLDEVPQSTEATTEQNVENATDELVMDCDQDYLDMVMPRNLTVRKVAELYGPEQLVPVIDVKSQETKGQWTLNDWANYYEQPGEKPIRNVISLEVSNSPIGKLIRRPKAVRDVDLEDYVWDNDTRTSSNKRPVQFYCLMSVADSYTDFHIDFGGSSVYYHILKGVKTFFFIPPEDKYLKEYEKWCNSDAQNDTWLGDLCNGNVTRVDLHEGDTAFIPAGWIHSVWTPEDSLVIGGNFLTRCDYELQLRVMNIEKATRVPQKFRYPFFQKVMWYALLKYLEEDPVPEEVLKDFHADEDYRYLRADPIWLEQDEFASDVEPGEPTYNARRYPKSEMTGLSHLRDYLYRTACIHADIPVPDINKKQIDAVKASIPKGHGDPMRLIKTFAVWCAWKMGNEMVPRWVHDQGDGLTTEIKEREKAKEETFRVPPERVSARNASKAKAASPAVEVVATPLRATQSADLQESSSTKSRSGSRGGSLRVACDACRKRRIKCRHKEGDDPTANSSPPAIRPRTYSNVSVDIPKLASASPVSSSFDHTSTLNAIVPEFGSTSDLAQAALATLHSQSSDPNQSSTTPSSGGSGKKGRSKACEECRKSKRRCVHDEFGRIDPAKAAEPSKPRGSTNTKRLSRLSDEYPTKRHKFESDLEAQTADMTNISDMDIDMMIDPALMAEDFVINAIHAPTETIVTQEDAELDALDPAMLPPSETMPDEAIHVLENDFAGSPGSAIRSTPTKDEVQAHLHVTTDAIPESVLSTIPAHMRLSPEIDISYSPITVDGTLTESTEKPDVKMEDADTTYEQSRHPSHSPKQVARPVSDGHDLRVPTCPTSEVSHRASSSSERTLDTHIKSRRSSSNTSGTTHQVVALTIERRRSQEISGRPVSRASSTGSDLDADERFARELQAAENGLRRRASMKA